MKKKIFSTLLMGAFFLASMSMFTSCKDYDDDINKNKSEIEALKGLISNLQSAVDANNSAIAGLDAKYATKGELSDLAGKIANLVTNQQLQDAIAAAKSELQKAIDGKADKADLQALSDQVDGINTNLNNLSKDVDGIKSALNDPEKGLEAAHKQIALQQQAIEELQKAVKEHGEAISGLQTDVKNLGEALEQLKKDLKALDDRLTADINDLKKRMEEAEKRIDDFESKLSVLTLFIDRMLTGLLVKTDYMLNGIETLPVHMLLGQPALKGKDAYNKVDGMPGLRGKLGETFNTQEPENPALMDEDVIGYHDIWNELYWQDFKEPLSLIGFAGDLYYNAGIKYVNMFPQGHARFTLDPATAKIDGGSFFFNTDYKNVTETSVNGEGQYTRAAANTAIGEEDPIIVPVESKLAQSQVGADGVIDIPYTVNNKEKFVNTWVKNFVLGIENARTVNGYKGDAAEYFDFTSWSMRAPFVAANMTPAVEEGHTTRAIQSDWAMVVPNLIKLIALADNYPNFELHGDIKGDIPTDYEPAPYKHWTRVDNGEVAANHLYPSVAVAIGSIPTHQVVYNQTIDLKPFVETHAQIFGARFTRDAPLTEEELKELNLHYEYYIVDYTRDKYKTSESAHIHQVGDVTSSIFKPNSVDPDKGTSIVEKSEEGSIGREPIIRVELRTEEGDVVLYGYIKLQIVRAADYWQEVEEPMNFGEIRMECTGGEGFLTWHQVEAGIIEKYLHLSVAEFEEQYELDSDFIDPYDKSLGYGARRFVKIDGQFYDEDSYIRMIEEKYKLSDLTIDDVLKNNVQFAVEAFKAFAGRILWTHNYTSLADPENRMTDVLVWQLGTPYSAWTHAFKNGSHHPEDGHVLTAQEDRDYVEYLAAPDKQGISQFEISTYVRFVKKGSKSDALYVKLVIPAKKLLWAAGEVTNKTDGAKGNWFKLNSNVVGDKEVHINVPAPRDAKDTRIGVYDKLIVERGGSEPNWNLDFDFDLTDYWKDGVIKYANIDANKLKDFKTFKNTPDQDKVTFYFTLPHISKGNVEKDVNNYNGKYENPEDKPDTDYGTWTVKGWSGNEYTLALYKLGEDEEGNLLPDKPQNYTRFEKVWYLDITQGKPFYVEYVMPVARGTEIRVIKCKRLGDKEARVFGLNNDGLAYDIKRIPSGTGLDPKPADAYNAVDAYGLQGYWLVRLTEQEITKTKISTKQRDASNISKAHNKYITYWRDWIAEDILNYASHKELGEKETFTAYLEVDYAECYDIFAENSKYFNARFMRPLDFKPFTPTANIDARNNGAYFRVIDLLLGTWDNTNKDKNKWWWAEATAWTDWRDLYVWNGMTEGTNLWKFYGIHLDNGDFTSSYGAEIPYFGGNESFDWTKKSKDKGITANDLLGWQFTEKLLSEIRTDFGVTDASKIPQTDRTKGDFNSLENRKKFKELPIASMIMPGDDKLDYKNARLDLTISSDGRLHYKNDNDNRKSFHLFVPIHWSYYFGDEFEDYTYNFFRSLPSYAVININYTQGNNNQ